MTGEDKILWKADRYAVGGNAVVSVSRPLAGYLNVAADAQREGRFDEADEILRRVIAEYPLAELPVEVLCPLTTRILNAVWNANIQTISELIQRKLSDLRGWKNFGQVSISIIGTRLWTLGLNLAKQTDYAWIKPLPEQMRERVLLIPVYFPSTST